jgi:hypothetical protein
MARQFSLVGTDSILSVFLKLQPRQRPGHRLMPRVPERERLIAFKQRLVEARLANDAQQSAAYEGILERHGNGDRRPFRLQLHDSVTAALPNGDKSLPFQNLAGFEA